MKQAGSVAPIGELLVLPSWNTSAQFQHTVRSMLPALQFSYEYFIRACFHIQPVVSKAGFDSSFNKRRLPLPADGFWGLPVERSGCSFCLVSVNVEKEGVGGWMEKPERMGREAKMSRGWGSVERPPTPNSPPEVSICRLNWSNRHWLMRVYKCSWKTLFNRVVLMVERGDARMLTDKHPQRLRLLGRSLHFKVLVSLKPRWALS